MTSTKYNRVAVGGTFDKFHQGHRLLINKAFQVGKEVLIGVTSDKFGGMKGEIEPCNVRMSNLNSLLKGRSGYSISRLDDPYGVTVHDETVEAIVVSPETEPTAFQINEIRRMVLAEDGKPISSTRIRRGEIDPRGTVIKKISKNL